MPGSHRIDLDLRTLASGLQVGERVRMADLVGPQELVNAREHSYRRIDDFTLLHVLDFEVLQPYSLTMARPGLVCIQAIISGGYERWIGPRMDRIGAHRLQISNTPVSVSDIGSGGKLRGLLIACDRRHLIEHYQLKVDRIPPAYRQLLLSSLGSTEILELPLPAAVLDLADQILNCKYPEPLRGIFLGAKTVEMLCLVVSLMENLRPQRTPRLLTAHRKSQAISTAIEIYRREFVNPPTIEQLARRVGLNRNELTNGFREMVGLTPRAYAQMQRMERAQTMLIEGRHSISEIARRLGYEGYASFSRAYRAHYGRAPTFDEQSEETR